MKSLLIKFEQRLLQISISLLAWIGSIAKQIEVIFMEFISTLRSIVFIDYIETPQRPLLFVVAVFM